MILEQNFSIEHIEEVFLKRVIPMEKYSKLSKIKRLAPEGYAYAVEAMEQLKAFSESK